MGPHGCYNIFIAWKWKQNIKGRDVVCATEVIKTSKGSVCILVQSPSLTERWRGVEEGEGITKLRVEGLKRKKVMLGLIKPFARRI